MRTFILINLISILLISSSCRVKEPCEINNQGDICITNNTDATITAFIGDVRLFEVKPGEEKCITKNVGVYNINVFSGVNEWKLNNISVVQCENTKISVPDDAIWVD